MTIKPLRFASVLFRRTFIHDRCLSLAAAISFYAILSFVPFLLLAASLLSHFYSSSDQAAQDIIAFITDNLPLSTSAAIELISATVKGKTIIRHRRRCWFALGQYVDLYGTRIRHEPHLAHGGAS